MANDIGTGWSIAFGTSAYAAEITQIDADGKEIPVIDVTHMGTTTQRAKTVGDLIDEGSFTCTIHWDTRDMDELETAFGLEQTITLSAPIPSGLSTAGTIAGNAAITKHNWSAPLEDKMTGNYTVTWMGAVTMTEPS